MPVLAKKPGALRNGAPFKDWVLPSAMEKIRRKLAGSADGDRQMVKILAAVLEDGLPAGRQIFHAVADLDDNTGQIMRVRGCSPYRRGLQIPRSGVGTNVTVGSGLGAIEKETAHHYAVEWPGFSRGEL